MAGGSGEAIGAKRTVGKVAVNAEAGRVLPVIPKYLDFGAANRVRVLVCEPAKAGLVALAPRAGLRRWKTGVRPLSFLLLDVTYGESDVMQPLSVFRQVIQVRGWAGSGLNPLVNDPAVPLPPENRIELPGFTVIDQVPQHRVREVHRRESEPLPVSGDRLQVPCHERILRESLRVRLRCGRRRQTRAARVAENSDDILPLFCRVEEDVATLRAEIPPVQDRDASICHSGKLLLHGSLGGSAVNQRHDALPVRLPIGTERGLVIERLDKIDNRVA